MAERSFSNDPQGVHSRKALQRSFGRGHKYDFLNVLAYQDTYFKLHDFDEDTINLDYWAVANSSGTSAADFAIAVARSGQIQADTGTDDNGSVSLIGPKIFYGDAHCGVEFRIKTDVVVDFNLECGWATAAPGSNAAVFTDVDTPTIVTDSAIFAVDTDQTIATAAFGTDGSTANQDVKRTTLAGIPGFTAGNLPVLATFYTVRIQLEGNSAYCYVNNKLVASHNDDPQGNIEGGTAVAPWVYCRTRSTTAVFPQIDYIALWQDR